MAKKICLTSMFGFIIPIRPDQLVSIKPDRKYPNLCHVETSVKNPDGKNTWHSVLHSAEHILNLYSQSK